MAEKLTVTQLVERNKQNGFPPMPFISEMSALPQLLILTCADPRCTPENFLGLKPGEGVLVLKNVCGHVAPAMDSILALDNLVTLSEMMIIHHTDCRSIHFQDSQVRETLQKRVPGSKEIDGMTFGAVTDIEQSVKDDLAILKSSPLVRKELKDHSMGFVYDIRTGKLAPVKVQDSSDRPWRWWGSEIWHEVEGEKGEIEGGEFVSL